MMPSCVGHAVADGSRGSGGVERLFHRAFKVLPGLNVTFGDQLIRVYGTTAVNTGYYTLRLRIASLISARSP
jgi:hypothetical protein